MVCILHFGNFDRLKKGHVTLVARCFLVILGYRESNVVNEEIALTSAFLLRSDLAWFGKFFILGAGYSKSLLCILRHLCKFSPLWFRAFDRNNVPNNLASCFWMNGSVVSFTLKFVASQMSSEWVNSRFSQYYCFFVNFTIENFSRAQFQFFLFSSASANFHILVISLNATEGFTPRICGRSSKQAL